MKAVFVAALAVALTGCGAGAAHRDALSPAPGSPAPSSSSAATSSATPAATTTRTKPVSKPEPREHLRQPIEEPECSGAAAGSPHFATPEAAMRFLAAAWNRNDLDALCHVTNPNARLLLLDMHQEAVNLRLDHCRHRSDGSYSCVFRHDYPASMHRHGTGRAWFDAAPARNPGWYMAVFIGCG